MMRGGGYGGYGGYGGPFAGRGGGGPFAGRGGGGIGFPVGLRPATCYKCGGPNHFARDCQAQSMKCYACGEHGHISRDCERSPQNEKTCYTCSKPGHIAKECPMSRPGGGQQSVDGMMGRDVGVAVAGGGGGGGGVVLNHGGPEITAPPSSDMPSTTPVAPVA